MQWPIQLHSPLKHIGHKPGAACEHNKNIQKTGNISAEILHMIAKCFQLHGDPLTKGSVSGPHWGLSLSPPLYARATMLAMPPPPFQLLDLPVTTT